MSPSVITERLRRAATPLCIVLLGLFPWPIRASTGIAWDEPWALRVNGQQLSVQTFSSALPPDAVAQQLVRDDSNYERYLVSEGRILLSGITSGQHRVADIQVSPGGSHGYVSTLVFVDVQAKVSPGNGYAAPSRLVQGPPGAGWSPAPRRVFEFPSAVTLRLTDLKELPAYERTLEQAGATFVFTASDTSPNWGLTLFMPEE